MEICQGLGLALAVGIGGPIAALFIAVWSMVIEARTSALPPPPPSAAALVDQA